MAAHFPEAVELIGATLHGTAEKPYTRTGVHSCTVTPISMASTGGGVILGRGRRSLSRACPACVACHRAVDLRTRRAPCHAHSVETTGLEVNGAVCVDAVAGLALHVCERGGAGYDGAFVSGGTGTVTILRAAKALRCDMGRSRDGPIVWLVWVAAARATAVRLVARAACCWWDRAAGRPVRRGLLLLLSRPAPLLLLLLLVARFLRLSLLVRVVRLLQV